MAEKQEKDKLTKMINTAIIVNGALIVLVIVASVILVLNDSQKNKVIVNGQELPEKAFNIFIENEGERYLAIEDFLNLKIMKMFKLNNGSYLDNKSNDSNSKFYIDSIYEAVQFDFNGNEYVKHIKPEFLDRKVDENGNIVQTEEEKRNNKQPVARVKTKMDEVILNQEKFKLVKPILEKNGKRYITLSDAKYAFNIVFSESKNKKIISISTIDYLEKRIAQKLINENYSLSDNYQNRRAIIDNYIIVNLGSRGWGINEISNGNINLNKVPTKYEDIRYAQNNKNAYVIDNGKVALFKATDGKTIIELGNYDTLSVYSEEKEIYLVSRNKKYGLLGSDGKLLVPIDFGKIGYDLSFFVEDKKQTDGKIFGNNLIPVMKDGRWGIYSLEGISNKIFDPVFFELGYRKFELVPADSGFGRNTINLSDEVIEQFKLIGKTLKKTITEEEGFKLKFTKDPNFIKPGENALVIPENTGFGGIVVRTENDRYGIISTNIRNKIYSLPPSYERIYKVIDNGNARYFAEFNNGIDKFELTIENSALFKNTVETQAPQPEQNQVQQAQPEPATPSVQEIPTTENPTGQIIEQTPQNPPLNSGGTTPPVLPSVNQ